MIVLRFRLLLVRFMPLLGHRIEVAPACCGVRPTCVGTAAAGVTVTWIAKTAVNGALDAAEWVA
jgi:hypothetical protein